MMWASFVLLVSLHGTVRFVMPIQYTEHACRSFAHDFIKAERTMRPLHSSAYSCRLLTEHNLRDKDSTEGR
jgi:hypothetical protein